MKTTSTSFLLLALAATALAAPSMPSAELQVLDANNQFSSDMYKSLAKDEGNVFFSPLSAHAVLSMAYQGAGGHTKEAFAGALNVPDPALAADGYDNIMQNLNSAANITLLIANKAYVMEGINLKAKFQEAVTKKFHSEVESVNFADNEAAANSINGWVNEKTHEKIPKLFEKEDMDGDTRLVLVNAIYFKGDWETKFEQSLTRTEPFYVTPENTIDAQMMHRTGEYNFKYDRDLDAKVLELKYKNQAYSMVVILPNKKDGIADLEAKLADYDLSKVTEGMYSTEVQVALPKFKIEQTIDLQSSLTEMGLGEIFDSAKCDLSEMIDSGEQLYVSKAIQKAYIEVNEEGSTAAAATGFVGTLALSARVPVKVYANHPFVLLLKASGSESSVLFHGRVFKPEYGDDEAAPRAEPDDQDMFTVWKLSQIDL